MRYYKCIFGEDFVRDSEKNPWVIFPDEKSEFFMLFPHGKILQYEKCQWINPIEPVPFYVEIEGTPIDFNMCLYIDFVVSSRAAEIIESIAPNDIQRIPVLLNNCIIEHEIINILHSCDCINHEQSVVLRDTKCDTVFPGDVAGIIELDILAERTEGHHIFRLSEHMPSIIISQTLRDAFRAIKASGLTLYPATSG